MAGGKGTRMTVSEEKPLLRVGGKPVIEYVLKALENARKVDSIVVAVSDYTPKTAELMAEYPVTVVKTPGREYVFDLGYTVKALKLQTVMAVAADLPLIKGEIIDAIIEHYERCGKPALAVVVPMETKEKLGMAGDYSFVMANRHVVPAGINVIDGRRIDEEELDQEVFLLDLEEVAVNINTVQELEIAEKLFAKASRK
jgi:adenosylcobinamide-phosphate guanylyltransferase